MSIGRRDFLKRTAGLVLAAPAISQLACTPPEGVCSDDPSVDGATPGDDPAAIAEDAGLFDLGVQSGGVTHEAARLWTHVAASASVELVVWRTSDAGTFIVKRAAVTPVDGYVHVDLTGLAPGQEYRYGFVTADTPPVRSPVGRFRTAFEAGCRRTVTFGATACTNFRFAPYESLERMAAEPLDAFLHLGDMSYNDGAVTQEDYRAKWRQTLTDPGYRAILAATSMYATWDDHEVDNNTRYFTKTAEELETAKAAYFEHVAQPRGPNGELWRSYRWGDTAEVFILDCRSERVPGAAKSPDDTYVSRAQLDWLKAGLAASAAHFKVVLNSVPITDLPGPWDLAASDRWEGYAAQRDELLGHLVTAGVRNVWFISGDLHVGTVGRVDPSGPRSRYREILVGPGANENPLWFLWRDGNESVQEDIMPAGRLEFFGGLPSATFLTFDPVADTVRVRFVSGADGTVLYDMTLTETDPPAAA